MNMNSSYDPDANVHVTNLPSDYGKQNLYQLFSMYGQIVRYKFVSPQEPTQPAFGFVQFANRKDAHHAIQNLEGHVFNTGETINLGIAISKRSSLANEPTNLYVKNIPFSWTNQKLRKVFGAYGQIRQSKVVGDGIAFVRFEDHEQALCAIGHLDKHWVEQGCKLEVRFATRKTAAKAYKLQQMPQRKTNENNLYVSNLPKYYNESSLEALFANYGKISSAKINDKGMAFVRFAHAEDAKRAIQELNGKKPPQFEQNIVVKLAHFDIFFNSNKWSNKWSTTNILQQNQGQSSPQNQAATHQQQHAQSTALLQAQQHQAQILQQKQLQQQYLAQIQAQAVALQQQQQQHAHINNLKAISNDNNNMNRMQAIQQQMQQWSLSNNTNPNIMIPTHAPSQNNMNITDPFPGMFPNVPLITDPTEIQKNAAIAANSMLIPTLSEFQPSQYVFPAANPIIMAAPAINMKIKENDNNNNNNYNVMIEGKEVEELSANEREFKNFLVSNGLDSYYDKFKKIGVADMTYIDVLINDNGLLTNKTNDGIGMHLWHANKLKNKINQFKIERYKFKNWIKNELKMAEYWKFFEKKAILTFEMFYEKVLNHNDILNIIGHQNEMDAKTIWQNTPKYKRQIQKNQYIQDNDEKDENILYQKEGQNNQTPYI